MCVCVCVLGNLVHGVRVTYALRMKNKKMPLSDDAQDADADAYIYTVVHMPMTTALTSSSSSGCEVVKLDLHDDGDAISRVRIRYGALVDSITLTTRRGREVRAGGAGGDHDAVCTARPVHRQDDDARVMLMCVYVYREQEIRVDEHDEGRRFFGFFGGQCFCRHNELDDNDE